MAVTSRSKRKLSYPQACELCGKSIPRLERRGLHVAHIVTTVSYKFAG